MKPFGGYNPTVCMQRIFNYRLSRARRIVEKVTQTDSSRAQKLIVLTVAHLHNFLRRNTLSLNLYAPPGTFDEDTPDFIEGSCRACGESTSFLPLRNVPHRSCEMAQGVT